MYAVVICASSLKRHGTVSVHQKTMVPLPNRKLPMGRNNVDVSVDVC